MQTGISEVLTISSRRQRLLPGIESLQEGFLMVPWQDDVRRKKAKAAIGGGQAMDAKWRQGYVGIGKASWERARLCALLSSVLNFDLGTIWWVVLSPEHH